MGPSPERQKALQREFGMVIPSIRQLEPDAIFIIAAWSDQSVIDGCIEALLTLPAEIHLGPGHALQKYSNAQLQRLGPIASLQLVRAPAPVALRADAEACARPSTFDAWPGVAHAAPRRRRIPIKLDSPGPVFFLQRRYGFNQQPFRIIKFRTMAPSTTAP